MERTRIKSTNLHSVGHDASGLEVQFHAKGCRAHEDAALCNCQGGDVWHYAGAEQEHHTALLNVDKPGSYFYSRVLNARGPGNTVKYPATKRSL